jgi:plasmid stabilization system protein ParE
VNVRFLTIAEQEIDDTYHWFEERTEGSGLDFLKEIDRVIRRISTFPLAALEIEPEIRRSLLTRFPYAIFYGIDGQTIIVIAVAHTHRKPRYWIDRVAK